MILSITSWERFKPFKKSVFMLLCSFRIRLF
nr:MAG TPA: hypothetical protein [Caudoviricetes sp.]DAT55278.1 MAG TPA: hypothetical protein [Caudoviricetes sp.]